MVAPRRSNCKRNHKEMTAGGQPGDKAAVTSDPRHGEGNDGTMEKRTTDGRATRLKEVTMADEDPDIYAMRATKLNWRTRCTGILSLRS